MDSFSKNVVSDIKYLEKLVKTAVTKVFIYQLNYF